jgi:murein DD-endopeptidase MepM/ murein hydrolase activator NlpD
VNAARGLRPRFPGGGASAPWSLEVQVHPGDIRRRVRTWFFSRRHVTAWSVLVLAFVLYVALAAALAPGVLGGLLNREEYFVLVAERTRQGERLQELVGRLDQLQRRADGLDLQIHKVFLAYDLPRRERQEGGLARLASSAPPVDSIYSGAIQQGDALRARILDQLRAVQADLGEVHDYERDHQEEVRGTPAIGPLRGDGFVLTSPFGRRRSPFTKEFELHPGIDFAAPKGLAVHAPADGVVAFAGRHPLGRQVAWWRLGNLVILRNGERFVTVFGHLDEVRVKRGERVRRGDVVATVGSTGWSTSPQLHYEVRRRDEDGDFRPVDPLVYILDHRWPNEERLLLRAAADGGDDAFEPLPRGIVPKASGRSGRAR